ncbi:hypothetical protein NV379_02215 [Paenibacillus sp. N1-5-1-14]|uniref:hypothetical protein n=1 Tax=Paenibacillus radicibacter TaxID=2972488 RepID=UPI002159209A|nr:hypothetical protein [Paenibacillus radicibacter]MCR8641461.1 hypothetical protein [Paenibacillus radicibacter]
MVEITKLVEYRNIKNNGVGFLAITDKKLPVNCVHHTSCYEVKEMHFKQKVIISGSKNGSYYFTSDYQDAINKFKKMKTCQKCFGE